MCSKVIRETLKELRLVSLAKRCVGLLGGLFEKVFSRVFLRDAPKLHLNLNPISPRVSLWAILATFKLLASFSGALTICSSPDCLTVCIFFRHNHPSIEPNL